MQRYTIKNNKAIKSEYGEYILYSEAIKEFNHMHKECDRLLSIIESLTKELDELKCQQNTHSISS